MSEEPSGQRGFSIALLLITLAGGVLLFSPFTAPILFSLFLAVALYPPYERLSARLPKRTRDLHAGVAVLILVMFLLVPLTFLAIIGVNEAQDIRENAGEWRQTFQRFREGELPPALTWLRPIRAKVSGMIGTSGSQIQSWVAQYAGQVAKKTAQISGQFFIGFVGGLANLFFLFFTLFFFFRDGPAYFKEVRSLIPLDTHSQNQIFERLQKGIAAIIRGWGLTVLAQGTAATLGFLIVGVSPAVLLGILAGIAGIIPIGGTGLIWGPAAIVLLASGSIGKGLFLIFWGVCMVGLIDNLLAPFLIGNRMHMPLIFLLFGIIGGVATLGVNGLFIGPLILSVTPVVFDIYRRKALHAPKR